MSDHDWIRDSSVPQWRGWHAFRRGVATNLQHLGANVVTAQGALRHSDANVTLKHYSKVVRDDVRMMMEKLGDARIGQ
jgi:integrase